MKAFVVSRGVPSKKYPLYGIFEFDQAKALAKNGVDTSMLVIDFRSRKYKRKYGLLSYEKEGVKIFELSLPLNLYRRAFPFLQLLMLFLYKKAVGVVGVPDVIHAHFYSIAAIASVIKRKYDVPFFVTEHSSKLVKDENLISRLDKRLTIKAYSNADVVISVSDALSGYIKSNFGYDTIVIHDVVDTDSCQSVQRVENKVFAFVSAGNLIYGKGFDILIKAFAKAFHADSDVVLNIVGEGEERKNLQDVINECGVADKVRLLGQKTRPELFEVMRNSDAFVLASRGETFGVVYIEAMICGLPVIATRCGGPEDFVDETNGVLIPADDIDALAKALTDMRIDVGRFDKEKISRDCYNNFSPDNIARQIVEQYYKVLR